MGFMTIKQAFCIHDIDLYSLKWILEASEQTFFIKDDSGISILCHFIYILYYYFHRNALAILDLCYKDTHNHLTIYWNTPLTLVKGFQLPKVTRVISLFTWFQARPLIRVRNPIFHWYKQPLFYRYLHSKTCCQNYS